MNLDDVITKQQGVEAMQYVIANVSDDSFMDYVANYLYNHYKLRYLETSPIPEGISTMIDIWLGPEMQTINNKPAFILSDKERILIGHQFYKAFYEQRTN